MRTGIKILLVLVTGLYANGLFSQETLSYSVFIRQVLENHPLALNANLTVEESEAMLRAVRGNFDPVLAGGYNSKEFKGSNYFRIIDSEIRIPTVMGVTVTGGYEQASGTYLNPEFTLPESGLLKSGRTEFGTALLESVALAPDRIS